MDNKRYTDRCGNCAFGRPTEVDSDKVECICGGEVSEPMSKQHPPCICYRPNVKEARKRIPEAKTHREPVKLDPKPKTVVWLPDMDAKLRELCAIKLNTIYDIAKQMGMSKKEITNRINALGIIRKSVGHASKAKTVLKDGNNLPLTKQKYPRLKCCKGQCCKYKEQCAHYAHWIEMGKPQFDTINSVRSCINAPYHSGDINGETRYTFREFLSLDMKSRTPEPTTYTEIC